MTNISSVEQHQMQADINSDPYDFSESEAQPDAIVYSSDESTQAAQSKLKPLKKRPYPMPAVTEEAAPVQNASVSNSTGASPLSVASDSPLTEDAASSPSLLAKRKRKNSRVQRVEGGMGVNISVSCDPPTVPTQTPPQPSPATALFSPSLINDLRSIIASAQPTASSEKQSPISSRTRSSDMVQHILSRNSKLSSPAVAKPSEANQSESESPASPSVVKRGRGRPPRDRPAHETDSSPQTAESSAPQPESPKRTRRAASSKRSPPLDSSANSEAALLDPKSSGLTLRIKTKFVPETTTEEGLRWRIDDVCWGKVLGYPWWPARIAQIQECNRYTNESLSPTASDPPPPVTTNASGAEGCGSEAPRARVHVSTTASALLLWFGSNTRSWVSCAELRPFLAEYSQRLDVRRSKGRSRSANYMRAVRQAEAAARRPPATAPAPEDSNSALAVAAPVTTGDSASGPVSSAAELPPPNSNSMHVNTSVAGSTSNEPAPVPSLPLPSAQSQAESEPDVTIEWPSTDAAIDVDTSPPPDEPHPAPDVAAAAASAASISTVSKPEPSPKSAAHLDSAAPSLEPVLKASSDTDTDKGTTAVCELGDRETVLHLPLSSSSLDQSRASPAPHSATNATSELLASADTHTDTHIA